MTSLQDNSRNPNSQPSRTAVENELLKVGQSLFDNFEKLLDLTAPKNPVSTEMYTSRQVSGVLPGERTYNLDEFLINGEATQRRIQINNIASPQREEGLYFVSLHRH